MRLNQIIRLFDMITKVRIFTSDQEEDEGPIYEGCMMDVPWYLVEKVVGRKDKNGDEPIYIYNDKDKNDAVMVINLLD